MPASLTDTVNITSSVTKTGPTPLLKSLSDSVTIGGWTISEKSLSDATNVSDSITQGASAYTFTNEMNALESRPFVMLEIDFPTGTEYFSQDSIRYLTRYYKGNITFVSSVRRSMQQNLGLLEIASMDAEIADTNGALIQKADTGQIKGVLARFKIATEHLPMAFSKTIMSGYIDDFGTSKFAFRVSVKDRFWTIPAKPNTGYVTTDLYPNALPAHIGLPLPVCYGIHSDTGTLDETADPATGKVDYRTRGAWPTLFVDVTSTRRYFLVADHPVKSIDNVYSFNEENGSQELTGTDYTSYPVGTINGKLCAYVSLTSAGFAKLVGTGGRLGELSVNVHGKEDIGNGTGQLIENPVYVLMDFFRNYCNDPQINQFMFESAAEVARSRLYLAAGGYIEEQNTDEFLAGICDSFQIRLFPDSDGRLGIDIFEPAGPSDYVATIGEQWDILKDSWSLSFASDVQGAEDSQVINTVEYKYNLHWRSKSFRSSSKFTDATSVTTYGIKKLALDLPWSSNSNAALDVANRMAFLYRQPTATANFKMPLKGMNIELGDMVKITHADAPVSGGYVDRLFEVITHTLDAATMTVDIKAKDVETISENGFFLGDSDVYPPRIFDFAWGINVTNGSGILTHSVGDVIMGAPVNVGDLVNLKSGGTTINAANEGWYKIEEFIPYSGVRVANTTWVTQTDLGMEIRYGWSNANAAQKAYGHLCDDSTQKFANNDSGQRLL